ncbi:MAG TPA: hypothetical protein VFI41_02755 [Gemmatimonadales bacterium]|nr:hypothetical protein [Gemmatimonadales bacterium]
MAMGLYRLRDCDRSVKLGAILFLLMLGYAYIFAFFMVKTWAGLSPSDVQATYVPSAAMSDSGMPMESQSSTQPLDLSSVPEMKHTVDTALLIQDSHIHIMIFALIAALQTLIVLGLGWNAPWRNLVILGAFGFGSLDFAGQWLMKAGIGGFAWLTILSGWGMTIIYLVILVGTVRAAMQPPAPRDARSFA